MKIFLDPHGDDAVLFASFTLLREKPLVVVVFDSYLQEQRGYGITAAQRRAETEAACKILGVDVQFLGFRDDTPDWDGIVEALYGFEGCESPVFAPAVEFGGHDHHSMVGEIAEKVLPPVRSYLTYTKSGKSTGGVPVPYEPEWALLKLRALACFESQIKLPSTAPHFLREQYEYYQA